MRNILAALALTTAGLSSTAQADGSIVLVELYTSQGCSSCPAADKILAEVAGRDDVLALGLHVDYWDYLGWQDTLARPEFTKRQARFNTIMKSRYRLVTPQMIFNGRDYVAGAKREKAIDYIDMLSKEPEQAHMKIERIGTSLRISLRPISGSERADIHVVRFDPTTVVAIKKGENAGQNVTYVNTVTEWTTIGEWDGKHPETIEQKVDGNAHYAVIVQSKNLGPVLVARRLD